MNIDQMFEGFERQAHLDFKLNFKKFFESENLSRKDAGYIALACAHTVNAAPLKELAASYLKEQGATEEEILEAGDASAAMGIANNYYRFRHYMHESPEYQKPAGFRMSTLAKPVTGKLSMELMSLAVSVINGCEACVQGHVKSSVEHGASPEAVHDVARLASTINGLVVVFRQFGR